MGRVVGDELGDPGEQQRRHHLPPDRLASAAVAAKTTVSGVAPAPRVRIGLEVDRDEVGALALGDPTRVVEAQRPVAVVRRGSEQLRGRPVTAALGGQPLVHLHRAHLLEQVDHRMAVGAQRQRCAGVVQPTRRTDPVGQVALGGRAEADVGARLPQQPDVVLAQVGRVHGGGQRTERSGLGEQLRGGDVVRRQAGFVLGDLLGDVDVQRHARGGLDDHLQLVPRHRTHRVDRGTDPRVVERSHPFRPRIGVTVGEAHLHTLRWATDTRREIAGVEQADPDPHLVGRSQQRLAHLVGVVVRRPVGLVVQVVELADRADAGRAHLGVGVAGELEVRLRRELRGHGVHLLAPGPERSPLGLRPPAQCPVERVRVTVGEARDGEAADGVGFTG